MIDKRIFKWVAECKDSDFTEIWDISSRSVFMPWDLIADDFKIRMMFFDALPQEVKNELNTLEDPGVNDHLYQISLYVFGGI